MIDLKTPDSRRVAAACDPWGCVTMTLFAAFGVYIVRKDAGLSFWLALAAHAQIALA